MLRSTAYRPFVVKWGIHRLCELVRLLSRDCAPAKPGRPSRCTSSQSQSNYPFVSFYCFRPVGRHHGDPRGNTRGVLRGLAVARVTFINGHYLRPL